jgi:predicted nucleotidyltransferase
MKLPFREIFREGDFIESLEGLIFDVKGFMHPSDRVVAFVRYVPDSMGDRARESDKYRKIYDLAERYFFLQKTIPDYLVHDPIFDEDLIEVPRKRILRHYEPLTKTCELLRNAETPLERKTVEMISHLASVTSIPREEFGVSGSILVGLAGPQSDIDIVIYGSEKCFRVRRAVARLLNDSDEFKPFSEEKVRALYESRHSETGVLFEDYSRCEVRKDFQGYFKGTEFFLRYIKETSEIDEEYGSAHYQALGYGRLEGVVTNQDEAIFTPCTYPLKEARFMDSDIELPKEVVSFRGQFCEQAEEGERVVARGKIERQFGRNETFNRLLLGNTRRDFMVAYPSMGWYC